MQGRGDATLSAARALAERAAKPESEYGECSRSLPILTLLRLERWDVLLAEPLPAGDKGMAQVLAQHARGVALARRASAAAALERLKAEIARSEGRAEAAESTYSDDLKAWPESGWALNGLARALAAQGKTAQAAEMRARAERVWALADAALTLRS